MSFKYNLFNCCYQCPTNCFVLPHILFEYNRNIVLIMNVYFKLTIVASFLFVNFPRGFKCRPFPITWWRRTWLSTATGVLKILKIFLWCLLWMLLEQQSVISQLFFPEVWCCISFSLIGPMLPLEETQSSLYWIIDQSVLTCLLEGITTNPNRSNVKRETMLISLYFLASTDHLTKM